MASNVLSPDQGGWKFWAGCGSSEPRLQPRGRGDLSWPSGSMASASGPAQCPWGCSRGPSAASEGLGVLPAPLRALGHQDLHGPGTSPLAGLGSRACPLRLLPLSFSLLCCFAFSFFGGLVQFFPVFSPAISLLLFLASSLFLASPLRFFSPFRYFFPFPSPLRSSPSFSLPLFHPQLSVWRLLSPSGRAHRAPAAERGPPGGGHRSPLPPGGLPSTKRGAAPGPGAGATSREGGPGERRGRPRRLKCGAEGRAGAEEGEGKGGEGKGRAGSRGEGKAEGRGAPAPAAPQPPCASRPPAAPGAPSRPLRLFPPPPRHVLKPVPAALHPVGSPCRLRRRPPTWGRALPPSPPPLLEGPAAGGERGRWAPGGARAEKPRSAPWRPAMPTPWRGRPCCPPASTAPPAWTIYKARRTSP